MITDFILGENRGTEINPKWGFCKCGKCIILGNTFFFFKQKTAYEIGTGDWSSDVCSSDLGWRVVPSPQGGSRRARPSARACRPGLSVVWRVLQIGRASCRERV